MPVGLMILGLIMYRYFQQNNVNPEIFATVLFSRNFAYAKLHENKILAKWRTHSVLTDIGKSRPGQEF